MYNKRSGSCLVISIVFLAFILAGMMAAVIYFNSLPPINQLKEYEPTLVSQVVSADGTIIKTFGSFKYKKVGIKEIPDHLKKAIIATEDKNFYHHRGFDPIALLRSVLSNMRAKRVVQGASTITQQLSRILFLSNEKTMDRKLKELIIAYRLEKTIPKDEILEMYLNNVYLGEGAYGVSAASEIYFDKSVEDLSLPECALIAGLPQAPSRYSPYQNLKYATERRRMVLERMLKMNYITQEEFDKANNTAILVNESNRPQSTNKAPYFADFVMRELVEKTGISQEEAIQGGYKIYTTLNYKYQKTAQKMLIKNLNNWGMTKPYQQGALLSIDADTGKILAYIGGKNYLESQFDRVSQAVRQPGSSFKMFVYTAAMERGLNPQTIYDDSPVHYGNWSPHNYANKYRGKIPLYKALAVSSNSVAVRLIKDLGVNAVISMARRLGITTDIPSDPTIALGSCSVKLFEMTNAYGVLVNGGVKVEPYSIERIETPNGKIIYQSNNSYSRVLDTQTAGYMVEMLKHVVTSGTGRAANIGRPAGGKTGTTDSYRDAWFVGFSPEIVTGVWIGNDNNTPTKGLTGGTVPAKVWGDYMRVVESDKPVANFILPDLLLNEKDKNKGTLPSNATDNPPVPGEEIQEPDNQLENMTDDEFFNQQNKAVTTSKAIPVPGTTTEPKQSAPIPTAAPTPTPPVPQSKTQAGNDGF